MININGNIWIDGFNNMNGKKKFLLDAFTTIEEFEVVYQGKISKATKLISRYLEMYKRIVAPVKGKKYILILKR